MAKKLYDGSQASEPWYGVGPNDGWYKRPNIGVADLRKWRNQFGSNALIFSQRYETLQSEASAAIVFSTLAFVATAPLWLAVLHAIG